MHPFVSVCVCVCACVCIGPTSCVRACVREYESVCVYVYICAPAFLTVYALHKLNKILHHHSFLIPEQPHRSLVVLIVRQRALDLDLLAPGRALDLVPFALVVVLSGVLDGSVRMRGLELGQLARAVT